MLPILEHKQLINKTAQNILDRLNSVFDRETETTLTRKLMEVVANKISEMLYLAWTRGDNQLFVDWAEGAFLDKHAEAYLLKRYAGENDTALRNRIYNAIKSLKITRPRIQEHMDALVGAPVTIYEYAGIGNDSWYLDESALDVNTRLWDTSDPESQIYAFWIEVPSTVSAAWFLDESGLDEQTILFDSNEGSFYTTIGRLAETIEDIKASGVTAYIILKF